MSERQAEREAYNLAKQEEAEWEALQDERDRDEGCVLGDKCLCPHPYHASWECFDRATMEDAERDPDIVRFEAEHRMLCWWEGFKLAVSERTYALLHPLKARQQRKEIEAARAPSDSPSPE